MKKFFLVLAVLTLLLAGCGQSTEVGSKELLDIEEQQQKERLGEILRSPEPTGGTSPGGAAALGAPSPTPTQKQEQQQQQTLEVSLVPPPEYYAPGQVMQLPAGTKVTVTNKDTDTAENAGKPRRFKAGPYDSGDLKVGQSYEFVANTKGRFQLADPNVPFATGTFEVF